MQVDEEKAMANEEKARRDTYWGADGLRRLDRLSSGEGRSGTDIAREALIEYEMSQSSFRDTVRDRILDLYNALLPNDAFDPIDDPRREKATIALAEVLNSVYAAQGIASALTLLQNQNGGIPFHFPREQNTVEEE